MRASFIPGMLCLLATALTHVTCPYSFKDSISSFSKHVNKHINDHTPAEVGVPVKADASFSVSRALQLQLPKQLAILEEVSEYASREYSLERALDKMQVW